MKFILVKKDGEPNESAIEMNVECLQDYEPLGYKVISGTERERYIEGYDPPEEKTKIGRLN